ncbi:hypothetical protein [Vibrio phage JSF12]|uniref:Uncharacterized protein n=2 Tax=Jesfedecavirus TaxID=2560156 RepID=A0A2D0YP09_9CAUD|nr:tail assembly chaperone [Vibrio phage JSF12]ASV43632.1 hypothetical protein [Vibrio phage JSF12]
MGFVQKGKNHLFKSLEALLDRQNSFTKARYLKICALENTKPDPNLMPLELEDFPDIVQTAVNLYNRLPDRLVSTELGPLYSGKDINSLDTLFSIYEIYDKEDQKLILEILQFIDKKAVEREVKRFKAAAKKASRQ